MLIDIQSFDPNEDPAVEALKKFSADGQTEITAEISSEVAQQQAAFAKQLEKAKNGTLTFLDSILELAVPAAQAGEKTKEEGNAWDNLNPDNPELAKWVDDYMKSSPAEQKATMAKLKKTRDTNRAIEKVAESLPDIEPLPDNPDHQTMVKKLAEIEARAELLLPHGKKLTNKKDRAFFLAEMKKLFVSCKELRRDLKNSRGNSISNMFDIAILREEIKILDDNHLGGYLGTKAAITENDMTIKIAAAEEAEAAMKQPNTQRKKNNTGKKQQLHKLKLIRLVK